MAPASPMPQHGMGAGNQHGPTVLEPLPRPDHRAGPADPPPGRPAARCYGWATRRWRPHEAGLDDDPPGLQLDVLPLDEGAERGVVRQEVLAEFAARAHPLGGRLARAPRGGGGPLGPR